MRPGNEQRKQRPPRTGGQPNRPGLATRKRAYLALMGFCLLLIGLSWTVIYRYSTAAAVAMSAAALIVPLLAVFIANAGTAGRR